MPRNENQHVKVSINVGIPDNTPSLPSTTPNSDDDPKSPLMDGMSDGHMGSVRVDFCHNIAMYPMVTASIQSKKFNITKGSRFRPNFASCALWFIPPIIVALLFSLPFHVSIVNPNNHIMGWPVASCKIDTYRQQVTGVTDERYLYLMANCTDVNDKDFKAEFMFHPYDYSEDDAFYVHDFYYYAYEHNDTFMAYYEGSNIWATSIPPVFIGHAKHRARVLTIIFVCIWPVVFALCMLSWYACCGAGHKYTITQEEFERSDANKPLEVDNWGDVDVQYRQYLYTLLVAHYDLKSFGQPPSEIMRRIAVSTYTPRPLLTTRVQGIAMVLFFAIICAVGIAIMILCSFFARNTVTLGALWALVSLSIQWPIWLVCCCMAAWTSRYFTTSLTVKNALDPTALIDNFTINANKRGGFFGVDISGDFTVVSETPPPPKTDQFTL